MGQIIEITIVIGQPGNFGANFLALKKDAGEIRGQSDL